MAEKLEVNVSNLTPSYRPNYEPPEFDYKLQAAEKVDYFLVLDFKGVINKDEGSPNVIELIEFPVLKINAVTLKTEAEFHTYVQPTIHPQLNSKYIEITGITQDMVAGKPTLPEALELLDEWMKSEGLLSPGVKFIFVTCGDWDLKSGISINCDYLNLEYKDYLKRWINIKNYFKNLMTSKPEGIKSMLTDLGLSLDGRLHSSIDDSRNIAKILVKLIEIGSCLHSGWVTPNMLVRKSEKSQEVMPKPRRQEKKEAVLPHKLPPKYWFKELPKEKMDYFLVLDFEANQNTKYPEVKEIIELPVLKLNVKTLTVDATFHTYVQPTVEPNITPFITDLTGITQDMVKGQPVLPAVLDQLHQWMLSEGLLDGKTNFVFVTCGDWDLMTALPNNCDLQKLEYHDYLKRWINIKTYFQQVTGAKGSGLDTMLAYLGLPLDGRHHSGIDDTHNIAKMLIELMRIDGRDLHYGWVQPRQLIKSE